MRYLGEGNGPLGMTPFGGFGGAWSTDAIPDARLPIAFTEAERRTGSTGLIATALNGVGDLLEGIGDVVGLGAIGEAIGDLGDLVVGDTDAMYGGYGAWGKPSASTLAHIEQLKARKKKLKAAIKHASGARRDKLKAELKQVNHALHLARQSRNAQRSALTKIVDPLHRGLFRNKKNMSAKEKAALAALHKRHTTIRRMGSARKLPWWALRPRVPQPRFVPPGYPPVPGYPYAPQQSYPGQVPGTYMVPGGSDLPPMPAGGPGYMNQTAMSSDGSPGADADGADTGDDGDDSKGGLLKIGLGVVVVGGIAYMVFGKKGRGGPKLSKAERRARRAGMGGPP